MTVDDRTHDPRAARQFALECAEWILTRFGADRVFRDELVSQLAVLRSLAAEQPNIEPAKAFRFQQHCWAALGAPLGLGRAAIGAGSTGFASRIAP